MGRPVTGAVAGAAVAAVLALAGCSDEQGPTVDDPVEPTTSEGSEPTAPTSPSSSGAAEPEPWEEKSKAGAKAFTEHWVGVFNKAVLTGKTGGLSAISAASCESCSGFMARIDDVYEAGGEYTAHEWRIVDTSTAPGGTADQHEFVLAIQRGAEEYRESAEGVLVRNPPSKATFTVNVTWAGDEWVARELVLL